MRKWTASAKVNNNRIDSVIRGLGPSLGWLKPRTGTKPLIETLTSIVVAYRSPLPYPFPTVGYVRVRVRVRVRESTGGKAASRMRLKFRELDPSPLAIIINWFSPDIIGHTDSFVARLCLIIGALSWWPYSISLRLVPTFRCIYTATCIYF